MAVADLVRAIQLHVDVLDRVSPRGFEEVVVELLAFFGWEVSVATASRRGGRHLLAFEANEYGLAIRVVVECRGYGPDRRVGVSEVRQLLGIRSYLGATKALLVTNSSFTSAASELANEHLWELQLVDRVKFLEWIHQYSPASHVYANVPRETFDSCFLSHSQQNQAFASMLYRRLEAAGVRVWYAPEHVRPGEKLKEQIDEAIRAFDRVIVVLSKEALTSNWVTTELARALRVELSERRRVLFPITLIPFNAIQQWECFDADLGRDIAAAVREYPVLDFTDWQNPSRFEIQFRRLLDGLGPARAA